VSWFASILTALVLFQSGADVCPMTVLAQDGQEHACEDHMPMEPAQIGAMALDGATAMAEQACDDVCEGGAACGSCAFLTALALPDLSTVPTAHPDLVRVFRSAQAPNRLISFDPPPPKA